jgi:tRNA threonylcarbamoyladenosine biosynthesis protein TsaE
MTFHAGPLPLESETATAALAGRVAARIGAGDTILLAGPIGAGKTAFARALIRARLKNPAEDVPSPTFTLIQTYEAPDAPIWHADLYRLGHPDEAVELGLQEAFDTAICLIEWPDRLSDIAPAEALTMTFAALANGQHEVTLDGPETWRARLETALA